jgi:hypothetical protein
VEQLISVPNESSAPSLSTCIASPDESLKVDFDRSGSAARVLMLGPFWKDREDHAVDRRRCWDVFLGSSSESHSDPLPRKFPDFRSSDFPPCQ